MRTTENLNYASLCKKIRRILKVMVLESWTSEIHLNGYSHEVTERQRGQRCLPRVCISDGDKCCSFFLETSLHRILVVHWGGVGVGVMCDVLLNMMADYVSVCVYL